MPGGAETGRLGQRSAKEHGSRFAGASSGAVSESHFAETREVEASRVKSRGMRRRCMLASRAGLPRTTEELMSKAGASRRARAGAPTNPGRGRIRARAGRCRSVARRRGWFDRGRFGGGGVRELVARDLSRTGGRVFLRWESITLPAVRAEGGSHEVEEPGLMTGQLDPA